MSTDKTPETRTKRRRWPWMTLAVIFLLLGGLRLALRSDMLLEQLRSLAETHVSAMMHGELRIERISGDLWSHVTVEGMAVFQAAGDGMAAAGDGMAAARGFRDPSGAAIGAASTRKERAVFSLDTLHISWSVIDLVFRRPLEIRKLHALGLRSELVQYEDGTWNALKLLPEVLSEGRERTGDGDAGPAFVLSDVRLTAAEILVDARTLLPGQPLAIREVTSQLRLGSNATGFFADLKQLELKLYESRLDAPVQLRSEASWDGRRVTLDKLLIATAYSLFEARGSYDDVTYATRFRALLDPLAWQDVQALVGEQSVRQDLKVALSIGGSRQDLQAGITLDAPGLENFSVQTRWTIMQEPVLRSLVMGSGRIDAATLTGRDTLQASVGGFSLALEGLVPLMEWDRVRLEGSMLLRDAQYEQYAMDALELGLSAAHGTANAGITLHSLKRVGYPELTAEINAVVTGERVIIESPLRMDGMEVDLSADVLWALDEPVYEVSLDFRRLDASRFPGLEQLSTEINGETRFRGAGLNPHTMALDASFRMSGSSINRQPLDQLSFDLQLRNGTVRMDEARLESRPAVADLSLRQNIRDLYDVENRLDFNLELKDLQGFADLAGAEVLWAPGRLAGTVTADNEGTLVLQTDFWLHDIRYDTLRVEEMTGSGRVLLATGFPYHVDLEVRDPSLGVLALRDISFTTDGRFSEAGIAGSYVFEVLVEEPYGLRQEAEYSVSDTIRLHTRTLRLNGPADTYRLSRPFDILWTEKTVEMDTLHLIGQTVSELRLQLERTPDTPWNGFVDAQNTDLGHLQYILLDEPLFGALFSGAIHFKADENILEVAGRAGLQDLEWEGTRLDSMRLVFDIRDRRLKTEAIAWHDAATLVTSGLDLPFGATESRGPDRDFFDQPVSGYLRIHPFDIPKFETLLERFGMEQTRGSFSLSSSLSGTAGAPELTGGLLLRDGVLSDVAIDSLVADWDYVHARSDILLTSRIHSLGQLAADISGRLPLHLDFRTMEFDGPGTDDTFSLTLRTSDFDLAAFNDFLDPERLVNLRGWLNADIAFGGTLDKPLAEGSFALSDGQVRLVENQVTLRNMRMDVRMEPGRVDLLELSAQSAGSLTGNGKITLDGMVPGQIDMTFRAINFRVFNTRDLEIYAGMDIRMTGTPEEPFLSGDVRWERGTIFLDDFGERQIEEVVLEEELTERPTGPEFFERLGMELVFEVDRNAYVRNRRDPEIFLSPRGEIDIVKEAFGELQLFGGIGVSSGHVSVFNKRFQLERGDVTFSGDAMEPELDIRTLYRPRQQYEDIRIFYKITGTLSNPEFVFQSEPEMELQDIVSYTLFGRPFHALAGWEQTMSGRSDGSMATNLAVDIMLDRIENLAADRLGIDVIEIGNSRRGGGGTSLKAGKFVSDRLFIAFLQELGGTDTARQVIVEYMLRRNLDLIITAGDDQTSGVDVMWRYDY